MALLVIVVFSVLPPPLAYAIVTSKFGADIRWWHAVVCGALFTAAFFCLWGDGRNGLTMFLAGIANTLAVTSLLILCWMGLQLGSVILDVVIALPGIILCLLGWLICPLIAAATGSDAS